MTFFLRAYYTFVVITFLATHQFRLSIPALPYPLKRAIWNSLIVSALCVGIFYGLALSIGLPLPFSLMTVTPAWTSLVAASLAVEWTKKIRETPGAGTMLVNAIKLWLCEVLLVFTYPVYYHIFTTLSKKGKTAFTLLLPVIKLIIKNIVARSVVHLSDEMPEVVVFNVEVFNALFVSYCMQNSPSIWITLEIMIFDVLMMAFSLRDAGNARRSLKDLERRINQEKSWDSLRDRGSFSTRCSSARLTMLDRASMLLFQAVQPEPTQITPFNGPNRVQVSRTDNPHQAPNCTKEKTMTSSVRVLNKSFRSIVPTPQRSNKQLQSKGSVHPATNRDENELVNCPVRYTSKVQRLVYAAEFLLLLNYVEVIIPLVHCECFVLRFPIS